MRTEFSQVTALPTETITERTAEAEQAFSELLNKLEELVPPGRSRSLVVTKLQEACDWARRGIAEGKPE